MGRSFDLLFASARVIDAASGLDARADVGVAGGQIAAVEPELSAGPETRVVDATGLALLPGLIDMHVHMFQPGRSQSFAHTALASAGVTTAVEMSDIRGVLEQWHASAAGLTIMGVEAIPALTGPNATRRAEEIVTRSITDGAIGVKIFGGHFPSSPEATAAVISSAHRENAYVAFHAGTTRSSSNLAGMQEALQLAGDHPVHIAHTNAYLRGTISSPIEENMSALELLSTRPNVVSEAHLAQLNICHGRLRDGRVEDQITINCLKIGGYAPTKDGLCSAIRNGFALVILYDDSQIRHVTGDEGVRLWEEESEHIMLSFPVNLHLSAYLQTCARRAASGSITFEGHGDWIVDAISSDGGLWRNVILENGLKLVDFGALSLMHFAEKTSLRPAKILGLANKGAISPGKDADLVLVDLVRRRPVMTMARGQVIFEAGRPVGSGGTVLTHAAGVKKLLERGLPYEILDLETSQFRTGRSRAVEREEAEIGGTVSPSEGEG